MGGAVLTRHAVDTGSACWTHTRMSGPLLEHIDFWLTSVGIEIQRLDVISTPGVAYLVRNKS